MMTQSNGNQIAFIIPYRDRFAHLKTFVPHIRQRFPGAPILVIEQESGKPFNRGKLLNIGFLHFNSLFDYFAAHDVDMLPTKADYSFAERPTHLATKVQQFGYKMPYPDYFGGVTLFNKIDFEIVNGYSNEFWGWGGEDDDIYNQFGKHQIAIDRRECEFKSLLHDHKIDFQLHRKNCARLADGRQAGDGLTSCEYHVISTQFINDYIQLKVML